MEVESNELNYHLWPPGTTFRVPHSWNFSPGEITFANTEDMATFTALAKVYSTKYFPN